MFKTNEQNCKGTRLFMAYLDESECGFHHLLVPRTSPAALSNRPCTELGSLEISGATNHSGPLMTPDLWLPLAAARDESWRWTNTFIAAEATASNRQPMSCLEKRKYNIRTRHKKKDK